MSRHQSSLSLALASLGALSLGACGELSSPQEVTGNFEVSYADNMRVYINDELVAEVTPGTEETVEWDGQSFQVSAVCGDDGTLCPSESYTRQVAVDQPWGAGYTLLNFVNLDPEHGVLGQRIGGNLANDRSFEMVAGLNVGANQLCSTLGVGTVTGTFDEAAQSVPDGIVAYTWAGGCHIGDSGVGVKIRLETDYSAVRTGDYDVSSVTPEQPIDDQGNPVDPEQPDQGAAADGQDSGQAG